ncbi:MAG: hypothetical protein EOP84_33160, partial [Verrucomicrobiaceae bacterium]
MGCHSKRSTVMNLNCRFNDAVAVGERSVRPRDSLWHASFLMVIAILLLSANPSAAATLTRLTTTGPRPSERSSPAVAAVGRSIYLFGGVFDNFSTGENLFHADLYRFVTTDNRWERIETTGPRPAARAFAGSGADPSGRRFFVYGGASYGPGLKDCIAFDDLWVYSERDSRWTKVEARNEGPSGRSRPSTWLIGHTFYVFGGVSEKFVTRNDLWALDLQTLQWKRLIADGDPGSPPPR